MQPMQEWKANIVKKKAAAKAAEEAARQAEIDAKEARWIGVPAWKRAIIEKKEAGLN